MVELRQMSIPILVTGHLRKLRMKMDMRKDEVQKWKNGMGGRIKKRLKMTFYKMGLVVDVQIYIHNIGEFGVQLSNNCWLVVNLSTMMCMYKRWGLPCAHVIGCHIQAKAACIDKHIKCISF